MGDVVDFPSLKANKRLAGLRVVVTANNPVVPMDLRDTIAGIRTTSNVAIIPNKVNQNRAELFIAASAPETIVDTVKQQFGAMGLSCHIELDAIDVTPKIETMLLEQKIGQVFLRGEVDPDVTTAVAILLRQLGVINHGG